MFAITKKHKRLFGRRAADDFNLIAAYLTNFCADESLDFFRPDTPSADNPPCMGVNTDWLADTLAEDFVTLDTAQTITGTKVFLSSLTITNTSNDLRVFLSGAETNGALELYGATPYIDFHYNNASGDYTSRLLASGDGILKYFGTALRLNYDLADSTATSGDTSRTLATMGWTNGKFWRSDATATGFAYASGGSLSYVDFGTTAGTVAVGNHKHTTADLTDWDTEGFLTSADIGVDVAAQTHSHGFLTSDGSIQTGGGIYVNKNVIVNSSGKLTVDTSTSASDVYSLVQQWNDAGKSFLTDSDIGVTVAAFSHTHNYASLIHNHGNLTFSGQVNSSAGIVGDRICVTNVSGYLVTDTSTSASDVATLVAQWVANGKTLSGGGSTSITTANIADWASATANFAQVSTVDDLAEVVTAINESYMDSTDVEALLEDYVPTSEKGAASGVCALDANAKVSLASLPTFTASKWMKTDSSGQIAVTDDTPASFSSTPTASRLVLTSGTSGNLTTLSKAGISATITLVTGVTWDGTRICVTSRPLTFTNGVLTTNGTASTAYITTVTYNA